MTFAFICDNADGAPKYGALHSATTIAGPARRRTVGR